MGLLFISAQLPRFPAGNLNFFVFIYRWMTLLTWKLPLGSRREVEVGLTLNTLLKIVAVWLRVQRFPRFNISVLSGFTT